MVGRSLLRPAARIVRGAPGYRRLRRGVIARLRQSSTARRMARTTYPDLLDERQVNDRVSAVRAELLAERNDRVSTLKREHRREMKTARVERKEELRRAKAAWAHAEDRRRRAKPAVSAGHLVAGLYLADRPLILLDVRGVDVPIARDIVEEIALEQVLGCAFRPMFLTDLADPSVWRKYGHLCEQVPPEEGWRGVTDFSDYLAQRMESIRADFDARWCLRIAPTGLTETQRAFIRRCGR